MVPSACCPILMYLLSRRPYEEVANGVRLNLDRSEKKNPLSLPCMD